MHAFEFIKQKSRIYWEKSKRMTSSFKVSYKKMLM